MLARRIGLPRATAARVGIGVVALGLAGFTGVGLAAVQASGDRAANTASQPDDDPSDDGGAAATTALVDDELALTAAALTGGTTVDAIPTDPSDGPLVMLQRDLAAARHVAPADRVAALQSIKDDLLGGEYGYLLQRVALHVARQNALPPELRADLAAARELAPDERVAALAEIRDTAREGGYGAWVEELADWLAARPTR